VSNFHWEAIRDEALEEIYYRCTHPSGLEIQVCPKEGYTSAYAVFSTKYGSIDTNIVQSDGSTIKIPEGTAHFLEHKLFESEEQDAFQRFAKTGASANAYTSFEKTAYEFTCSGYFNENLEILLDFVQAPYFTQATVEKEQGIIGQEIRMGLDSPGRCVFFQLMKALYPGHPVHIEIAGTEQSIAEISAELLHGCYAHYYDLRNMMLAVAGSAALEQVEAIAEKLLQPSEIINAPVKRMELLDNSVPVNALTSKSMEVGAPIFMLGCKEALGASMLSIKDIVLAELVMDILAGEASALFERLMDEGLINANFENELLYGWGYSCALFEGESKQPALAAEKIQAALLQAAREGLAADDFARARKKAYGRLVTNCNDIDWLANGMTDAYFAGDDFYARARALREITLEDANARVALQFQPGMFALSIINPLK